LKTLNVIVTVWEMKTLNDADMGSGENTPLIGSSPVVGTISSEFHFRKLATTWDF
jgi:hypothetical protein